MRAIPRLETTSRHSLRERECFTCHHVGHVSLALHAARSRGIAIDEENLTAQVHRTLEKLAADVPRLRDARVTTGKGDQFGIALRLLEAIGQPPGEVTAMTVNFLLDHDAQLDHWEAGQKRPPTVGGPFTTTYLVLRGLRHFGAAASPLRVHERTEAARRWLLASPSGDTEDMVFRLRTLHLLECPPGEVRAEAAKLRREQREDGGWGQLPQMNSDPYATATALAALRDTAAAHTAEAAFQAGLRYLLITQLPDGTWHVRKRTRTIQPFYDSGFPHKHDQFISVSATAWATHVLAGSLPATRNAATSTTGNGGYQRAP